MSFTWNQLYDPKVVTGETKASYQSSLSGNFGLSIGLPGFGAEIEETFKQSGSVKNFEKYASVLVIRLSRPEGTYMQRFLTPEAREIIETEDDTGAIVNALGTHFMTSAISGGLKRFASVLDVRNENVAEQHVIALSIKVKDTEPKSNTSAPGNIGEEMAVAKAIYSKIGNYITTTVGETYVEGQDAAWASSLYRDPSILDMQLKPISDLIVNNATKQASVLSELSRRLREAAVRNTASALIMYQSFDGGVYTDRNSRSKKNIATANVSQRQGWFSLGQYAHGGGGVYDWNPTRSQGIIISKVPGGDILVKSPDAYDYRWGLKNHGAFSFFELRSNNETTTRNDYGGAGVVHDSILKAGDASYAGGDFWNDHGTGARDSGSTWRVNYANPGGDIIRCNNDIDGRLLPEAFLFHANNGYGPPAVLAVGSDFSKVKELSNVYLDI